jgi:hypothetical protein
MVALLWCAGAGAAMCWYVIWRRTSAGRARMLASGGSVLGSPAGPPSISVGERLLYCSVWSFIGAMIGATFWAGVEFLSWLVGFAAAL